MISVKLFAWFVALLALTACTTVTHVTSQLAGKPLPTPSVTSSSTPVPVPDTPTPTLTASPTLSPLPPTPTETPTFIPPTATHTPSPTLTASPTPSPLAPTPTETVTPTPPVATPVPASTPLPNTESESQTTLASYHYVPIGTAQPDLSHPCPGCPRAPGYIAGRVVDKEGNGLVGVRLVCQNDWHRYPVVGTKGGGEYDFPILQAEAIWYVAVVDEADQPISPEVPVYFAPLEACWYRLDWQRMD
jgi:hypothetical protein